MNVNKESKTSMENKGSISKAQLRALEVYYGTECTYCVPHEVT